MRKRLISVMVLGAFVAGGATTAAHAQTTTTTSTTIPARGDADLVIWADDTRVPVLTPIANAFAAKNGIKIAVQELKFDQIRDQLKVAGPAGKGPDIIIGAHDWLGDLATNGLVEPLDLGAKAKLLSTVSVKAFRAWLKESVST